MFDYSRVVNTVAYLPGLLYLQHLWESNMNKGKRVGDIQAYRGERQRERIRDKKRKTGEGVADTSSSKWCRDSTYTTTLSPLVTSSLFGL